jgi:NADPH-dependent 2,4-dienoyl-CoA reductase/sulfur reductase-like enzyme
MVVANLHRDHGVDVRLGVGVVSMDGGDRVQKLQLTDGSSFDVDLVVVGIGVAPNTAWLDGSGLTIDNGVLCDEACRAAPGVVAAGDVARWPNARFDETMRVEHWDNAIEMGSHAARTLLADLTGVDGGEPYAPVPWFWSDQYDRKLQLAGRAAGGDEVTVVAGDVAERKFVAFYGRDTGQGRRLVGVLGMNMPAKVMRWRKLVEGGAMWDEALATAAEAG